MKHWNQSFKTGLSKVGGQFYQLKQRFYRTRDNNREWMS